MGYRIYTGVGVASLIVIAVVVVVVVVWLAPIIEQDERSRSVVEEQGLGMLPHAVETTSSPSGEPDGDRSGTVRKRSEKGSGVNPTVDRFGIPSSEVIALSSEEIESIQSERKRQGPQHWDVSGARLSTKISEPDIGDVDIDNLGERVDDGAPFASNIISSAPEESDQGIMGVAPEDVSNVSPQLPLIATDANSMDLGPGYFDTDGVGPAPEDSQQPPVVE